ncbi:hypothetical protein, partial [Bacillus mycoides]|uniref:hypothetical protein n=1 Tax=Bacillus mycoides TaxID=1405 RepID=UPI0036537606
GFCPSPLIISLRQSGVYGQQGSHLTPLLQLNFEVGVLLPTNSEKKEPEFWPLFSQVQQWFEEP